MFATGEREASRVSWKRVIVVIGLSLVAVRSGHRSSGHAFADRARTRATFSCTGGHIAAGIMQMLVAM